MAYEITLPRLGWDMVEGTLSGWLKKENDYVQAGEALFELEGDKAVQEIEALDSGYLRFLPDGPKPGDKLPVGTVIGYLVPEEELGSFLVAGESQSEIARLPVEKPALQAKSEAKPAETMVPSGNGENRRIYISPYARRLAQSMGIEWQSIKGSGLKGRIMAKDVEEAVVQLRAERPLEAPIPVETPIIKAPDKQAFLTTEEARTPMSSMRRKIAEHMAHSAHTSAPVTLTCEVDATELVKLRKALKADAANSGLPVPSYNDLLAKLSAQAIVEHPMVNARIDGNEIVLMSSVNIAIAVDTERGLIVPVLRDIQAKSLRQVARESAALIEKTRSGAVGYEDLQGATFTITNLGMFEIDAFTPIIDLPQCAILGVGRIAPKQVVVDIEAEKVAIRQMMFLSLTFDHRLIDGAQAARFLQRVKHFVENPYLWMAGV